MKNERHQYLVRFGYQGQLFYGLQPQKTVPTAGAALRHRLETAAGFRARGLNFAARTDRGVHALNNVATFYFRDEGFEPNTFEQQMRQHEENTDGLFAVRTYRTTRSCHARGASAGKRYRYFIDAETSGTPDPFSWRIVPPINIEKMRSAAVTFRGEHDFSCLRGGGCSASTPIKHLQHIRVRGPYPLAEGKRYIVEVVGNAFLRKMMRNLVALLVEIGTGWRPVEDAEVVLKSLNRQRSGICAPPNGLTLVDVGFKYPEDGSALIPEYVCREGA